MSSESPVSEIVCPYPGLRPFHFDEAHLFFGRAEHVNSMLGKLEDSRFLAVVGSSGSGKSSLVRAGLLPALDHGFIGGENWRFIVSEPGNRPISNLAKAIHSPEPWASSEEVSKKGAGVQAAYTEVALRRSKYGLVKALEEREGPVLLLVDQFEELFRYNYRERNRQQEIHKRASTEHSDAIAFVNLLLTAASQPMDEGREIYVVLTMRTEYLKDCELFHSLPGAISDSQFLTPTMERSQLIEAIEEPLRATGAEPGENLRHHVLNDIRSARDQLPLMQHALMQAWRLAAERTEKENGGSLVLRSQDYLEGGGVRAAISKHGDAILENFSPESQEIIRQIFVSLAQFQDDKIVRRPSTISEIAEIAKETPESIRNHAAPFLIDGCSFLYVRDEGEEPSLDISHESVTRQWEQFKGWLKDERESVDRYQYLLDKARRREENHGNGYILGMEEIPGYLKWRREFGPTKVWAERHGEGYSKAMSLLQHSFSRLLARFALGGFAMLVVFGSIFWGWKSNRDARLREIEFEKERAEEAKLTAEKNKQTVARLGEEAQEEFERLYVQFERVRAENSNLLSQIEQLKQSQQEQELQLLEPERLTKLVKTLERLGDDQREIEIDHQVDTLNAELLAASKGTTERINSLLESSTKVPEIAVREPKRVGNPAVEEWIATLSSESSADAMAGQDTAFIKSHGGDASAISSLTDLLAPIRFFQLHYNARLRLLSVLAQADPSVWSSENASQIRFQFVSLLRTHNSSDANSETRIGPAALREMAKTNLQISQRVPDVAGAYFAKETENSVKGLSVDATMVRTSDREIRGIFGGLSGITIEGMVGRNTSNFLYSGYLTDWAEANRYPIELEKGEGNDLWTVSYIDDDWKRGRLEWDQQLNAQYGSQVKVYHPKIVPAQRQLAFEVQNALTRIGFSPIQPAENKSSGGSDGARVRYFYPEDEAVAEKMRTVLATVHGLKRCETRLVSDPDASRFSFHVFLASDDFASTTDVPITENPIPEASMLLRKIANWGGLEETDIGNLPAALKQFQQIRLIPETGKPDDATIAELRLVARELFANH